MCAASAPPTYRRPPARIFAPSTGPKIDATRGRGRVSHAERAFIEKQAARRREQRELQELAELLGDPVT